VENKSDNSSSDEKKRFNSSDEPSYKVEKKSSGDCSVTVWNSANDVQINIDFQGCNSIDSVNYMGDSNGHTTYHINRNVSSYHIDKFRKMDSIDVSSFPCIYSGWDSACSIRNNPANCVFTLFGGGEFFVKISANLVDFEQLNHDNFQGDAASVVCSFGIRYMMSFLWLTSIVLFL
jgi:hypothetical protein